VATLRAVAAVFLVTSLGVAHGAEMPQGLFGDWGGLRTYLYDHGVNLEVSYVNEFAANTQGGDSRDAAYADQIYLLSLALVPDTFTRATQLAARTL
jgi:porin